MCSYDDFFIIRSKDKGYILINCQGKPPETWHNADDWQVINPDTKIIIFQYQRKILGDVAVNRLAFTSADNFEKGLEVISDNQNNVLTPASQQLNLDEIYNIPNSPTFYAARNFLVETLNLKKENILEENGNEHRVYALGLIS